MGIQKLLFAAVGLSLVPLAALADSWTSWQYVAGNTNTVSLEGRLRHTDGDTEVQWRIMNNTPDRIYGSVRNKVYTYGDGTTTSASDEGSGVGAWSKETFISDNIRGEVKWIEADLVYD